MMTADQWFAIARSQAAARGLDLHILERGEVVIRLGAWARSVHSRAELAAVLRAHGCKVDDPPQEVVYGS